MIQFITSSFVKFQEPEDYQPQAIEDSNYFVDNLSSCWRKDAHFLHFASDPENPKGTDHVTMEMQQAFTLAGLSIGEIRAFDGRTVRAYAQEHGLSEEEAGPLALKEAVAWADVFYLAGGHGPTEHAFLERCRAREALGIQGEGPVFDGIFIGLSAGSVNAAEEVYLLPELPGESVDPTFVRFTRGLGLNGLQTVPHWQYTRNTELDGKPFVEGVLKGDSYNRTLYLLPDGSYFMIKDGVTELFGPAEIMENGQIHRLEPGVIASELSVFAGQTPLQSSQTNRFCRAFFQENYDLILSVQEEDQRIRFIYASPYYQGKGVYPMQFEKYRDLVKYWSQTMVVPEERESVLSELLLPRVIGDIRRDGEFVRTIHTDTEAGIQAQKLTLRILEDFKPGHCRLLLTLVNIADIVNHDWMTDEYSRSGFLAEAEHVLAEASEESQYAIVYTNISGFKAINDLFSTQSGDMVIFHEREALRRILKPTVIARFEADHFVLLVEEKNLTPENFMELADQTYVEGCKQYQFTIRCGVYEVKDKTQEINTMVDRAKLVEKTLSSSRGKSYTYYDDAMRVRYLEQKSFASELDRALKKDEIITYYQPIVDAKTHKIVSAEALARWQHPTKGLLTPGRFVPAFEQGGQISKVDYRMVSNVLGFNQTRQRLGLPIVPCAVNLSRVDFYDMNIINNINQRLKDSVDVPRMLKVEVTESAYLELECSALDFLTAIKKMGMSVLLDDFGSGMSSMATLESFDFDIIKLDIGFISKIGKSQKAEAIIRSSIEMFHGLGAKVVAEGVEEREQLDFLTEAGCDYIQGYYFYRPMPAEEFAELL